MFPEMWTGTPVQLLNPDGTLKNPFISHPLPSARKSARRSTRVPKRAAPKSTKLGTSRVSDETYTPRNTTTVSKPSSGGSSAPVASGGGGGSVRTPATTPTRNAVPPARIPQLPRINMNPTSVDRQRARDLVELQFGPQRNSIKNALDYLQMMLTRDVDTQERFAGIADERLGNIYSELNQLLEGNAGRIQDLYSNAQSNIGGFYDQAAQTMSQTGQGIQDAIAQSAETLGLSNSGADEAALQRLQGQLGNIQSMHAGSKAGALGDLESLGANYGSSAIQAISDAARQGAFERSGLQRDVQSTIAELQGTAAGDRYGLLNELTNLAQQYGAAHRTTLQDLLENRLDRERQGRLDTLAEEIQRGTLDIQRGQLSLQEGGLNLSRQQTEWQRDQQLWERQQQQRQLEMQMAQEQDPVKRAHLLMQIQKMEAETRAILSGLGGQGMDLSGLKGVHGARSYAQQFGIEPSHVDAVERMLNQNKEYRSRPELFQSALQQVNPGLHPTYWDLYYIITGQW